MLPIDPAKNTKRKDYLSGQGTGVVSAEDPRTWEWEFSFLVEASEEVFVCSIFGGNYNQTIFSIEIEMYIYLLEL